MKFIEDIRQLDQVRDGMPLHELRKILSEPCLLRLLEHGLIYIDPIESMVFITSKGKEIRKIGLEKYLELEKLEQEYFTLDAAKLRFRNKLFLFFMLMFILVLGYLLFNSPVV